MYVAGCTLADTKGARRCPHCGERHLQKIHSVDGSGRPAKVECPVCRKVWMWPTVREDELARKEAMRKHGRECYVAHRDEILAREHKYKDYKTAQARERRHRQRAHIHKPRACATCGRLFVPQNRNHKYCSAHCRNNSPSRKRKNRKYRVTERSRNEAYLAALEAVAESVGRLDECRAAGEEAYERARSESNTERRGTA